MGKRTNATVRIAADVKDVKKGLNEVAAFLNHLKKSAPLDFFAKIGSSISGITSAMSIVTKAAKAAVNVVKETTEAYKNQITAERQLESAAKNNPFLIDENIKRLKNFSSELQSLTNYGDEQLLPLMGHLAAAGRTESEIMSIMEAATDVAANGMMSLEGAVQALNATYSGNTGQLGQNIAEVKKLTKEQLANGEAVKLIGERFKGSANAVKDYQTQLKNIKGDFNEALGSLTKPASDWWSRFWSDRYKEAIENINKITEALNFANKHWAIGGGYQTNKRYVTSVTDSLKDVASNKKTYYLERNAEELNDEDLKDVAEYIALKKNQTAEEKQFLEVLNKEIELRAKRTAQKKKEAELEEKYRNSTKEELEARKKEIENAKSEKGNATEYAKELGVVNRRLEELKEKETEASEAAKKAELDRRNELRASYTAAIEAEEARIQAEGKAGKKISESEKAQRLYNVALSKYIEMMSDPAFDRSLTQTGMWEGEQEMLNQIAGYATASFDTEAARKNFASFFPDKKTAEEEVTEYYTAQMEALQKLYDSLPEEYQKDFADDFAQAGERLATAQKEAMEKVHADERAELYSHLERSLEIVQNFIDRYTDVCSGIADIIAQNAEAAATSQTLAIEKQYAAGKLSAEQYEKSLKEIERRKAQESYRAQMWQWTANLAQATASTAQAVIQTLADATLPTAARIAMSAIIGAAGAAQLATVIGSKPIPPSFSTGGIVGGSSYYGDRISANVNSGEMILTRAQQRLLFDTINRGSMNGSMTNNVTIKNYASPDVSATVRQDGKALEVYIQKTVASQMEKGAYNRSLAIASMGMSGEKYTS